MWDVLQDLLSAHQQLQNQQQQRHNQQQLQLTQYVITLLTRIYPTELEVSTTRIMKATATWVDIQNQESSAQTGKAPDGIASLEKLEINFQRIHLVITAPAAPVCQDGWMENILKYWTVKLAGGFALVMRIIIVVFTMLPFQSSIVGHFICTTCPTLRNVC